MSPGALLRDARLRHGLSQQQLATRAGTTQSAISRIEHDQLSPKVETLRRLLDLVGERLDLFATPIDYGHDRAMLTANLALPAEDRLRRATELGRAVHALQRAADH